MRNGSGLGNEGTGRSQVASIEVTFKLRRRIKKLTRVGESVPHRRNCLRKSLEAGMMESWL